MNQQEARKKRADDAVDDDDKDNQAQDRLSRKNRRGLNRLGQTYIRWNMKNAAALC